MLKTGFSGKAALLYATVLAGVSLLRVAHAVAATPFGVFVSLTTNDTDQTGPFGASTPISPLFGPTLCTTGASPTCQGGVTGAYLSVPWNDFQKTLTSRGTTALVIDSLNNLSGVMTSMHAIESLPALAGFSFNVTLGLKPGTLAAYDVLDMYVATGGVFAGESPPYYNTTLTVQGNGIHGKCGFTYNNDTRSATPST